MARAIEGMPMLIWMNRPAGELPAAARAVAGGWLVPARQGVVSARDRGFLLGDGLFETLRVAAGVCPLAADHQARLDAGCRLLGLPAPPDLAAVVSALVAAAGLSEAVVRVTCSRGAGARGYEPPPDAPGCCVAEATAWSPPQPRLWQAVAAAVPVAPHPVLSRCKHTSALFRILARQEARAASADEALVLTPAGHLVEGAATNLFWVRAGTVYTPALASGCLPGVARAWVLRHLAAGGVPVREGLYPWAHLAMADEAFLTNALLGPVPLGGVQPAQGGAGAAGAAWAGVGATTAQLAAAWERLFTA